MIPDLEELRKFADFGIVAVSFLMVLWWLLKSFQATVIEAIRDSSRTNLAMIKALETLQMQLLTHDLTVRGLNPSAGGDLNERDSRAFAIYNDIMTAVKAQHAAIDRAIAAKENK